MEFETIQSKYTNPKDRTNGLTHFLTSFCGSYGPLVTQKWLPTRSNVSILSFFLSFFLYVSIYLPIDQFNNQIIWTCYYYLTLNLDSTNIEGRRRFHCVGQLYDVVWGRGHTKNVISFFFSNQIVQLSFPSPSLFLPLAFCKTFVPQINSRILSVRCLETQTHKHQ